MTNNSKELLRLGIHLAGYYVQFLSYNGQIIWNALIHCMPIRKLTSEFNSKQAGIGQVSFTIIKKT